MIKLINPYLKMLILIVVLIGIAFFSSIDWKEIFLLLTARPPFLLLILSSIFVFNFFLVSLRLFFLYRQFGYDLSYKQACETCLSGQLANLFFLPFVGSMFGQRSKLLSMNIPSSIIAFSVLYEKIFVSAIGFFLALISFFLFFQSSFSLQNMSFYLVFEAIFSFSVVVGIFLWQGLHEQEKHSIKSWISKRSLKYSICLFLVTLFAWLMTATSFVAGLHYLGVMKNNQSLMAGGLLTSFIASLPISVNGWGLREIAAIKIFGFLGVNQSYALYVSIFVGIASILAIILLFGLNKLKVFSFKKETSDPFQLNAHSITLSSSMINQQIIGAMGYLTAFLILFQFNINQCSYQLTVNFADLCALGGLFIFSTDILIKKRKINYLIPHTQTALMLFTGVLTISLGVSLLTIGFTKWAFFTRYVGWFILMGYFGLGVLCKITIPKRFVERMLDILVLSSCVILLVKHAVYFLNNLNLLPDSKITWNLEGYALNRNAFAFQLLIVSLFQLIKCGQNNRKKIVPNFSEWTLGIILAGIIMTASIAANITIFLILPVYIFLGVINIKQLIRYSITTGFFVGIFCFSRNPFPVFNFIINNLGTSNLGTSNLGLIYFNASTAESHTERIYTWIEGLKLGLKNPIFGAGLGYFLNREMIENGRQLIIHSTPIWIWAECGFMGICIFFWYISQWLKMIKNIILDYVKKQKPPRQESLFLIGAFILFSIMGLSHDMLYQRIFWFSLGLMIVIRKKCQNDFKKEI